MSDYENQKIVNVEISKEMKKSYIDYAMSVIVGRALPDVKDGLKPVHRRILYTMYENGITPKKAHLKCAATVGDVLGKYHPHGDAAVYDSMVRMAQDFSLRYPLIDGHGNFGSVDGDPPAAYRYTESRMSELSMEMLSDIEKNTVDFIPNYDGRMEEPVVLPARFPQLLVNGSSGIAVGMATNIPPHNLSEVINGTIALIDNPDLEPLDLMAYIKGPDFPTAGLIMGQSGIRSACATGRGRIIMRARTEIQDVKENKQRIVVTEIPYQVNKARLIEKIAELVKDKRIEGISDLRDESDRKGMHIVIELKRDANANIILNHLFKYTQLQETFSIINLALVDNQPKVLNLKEMLVHYIEHQRDVTVRRTKYDLEKAQARMHILEGLRIALDNIDRVIEIIRHSYDTAKEDLMSELSLSDVQAQAILDMRLGRLSGIEREKIDNEYDELTVFVADLQDILANPHRVDEIIKEELTKIKEKYGDERRTEIAAADEDIDIEDLIEESENVITLTHFGYVKRMPVDTYKSQHRGGRGISGMSTREEDFVEELFTTSTHNFLLFITNKGRMYKLKAYRIPECGRQAKGTAIVNLIPIEQDEKVTTVIPVHDFEEGKYLFMCTRNGIVKKTSITEYASNRKGGLNAIVLDEDDELIRVKLTDGTNDMIIGTRNGLSIRFNEQDVRPMGRVTRGVKSITLRDGDYVVGMSVIRDNADLLVVTENGYGKRTVLDEYRIQNRGGKGLYTYRITEKTGLVAGMKVVDDDDDIMLITSEGVIIRMHASDISVISRVTQGVRLMRLDEGVSVVGIARTERENEEEDAAVKPEETEPTEEDPEDELPEIE